jgi:plastocyanin
MFFSTIPLAFAALATVNAAVHDVTVGSSTGSLTFSPEALSANVGDQVVFHFMQKNHTATRSSFANPCGLEDGGFDSGFMPVPANQTDNFPTYTITVNDTKPVWVFCDQAAGTPNSHCGAGMVFAVNCPADNSPNSFSNFKKAALAIGDQLKGNATAAPPASASATPAPTPTDSYPWSWTTAAGGYSYPAEPSVSTVTVTVTVAESTWTTTYGSYPGSANPTPVAVNGVVHEVVVGNNGTLTYDPPFVMAQPRDTISFKFVSKNHTVTQSTFGTPCLPMINADGAPVLNSGFVPVSANTTDFPTWNVTVNTTDPLWFFCEQTGHCGKGMVFAVNPVQTSPRNFSAFQGLAQLTNGTNATSSSSSPNSTTSSPAGQGSGAGHVVINVALGLGSVLAAFALAL